MKLRLLWLPNRHRGRTVAGPPSRHKPVAPRARPQPRREHEQHCLETIHRVVASAAAAAADNDADEEQKLNYR